MDKAIIEGLKEMGRNIVMAIVPVIVSGINIQAGTFDINWNVVLATAILVILTGIDRWAHVQGKADGETGKSYGLVRL